MIYMIRKALRGFKRSWLLCICLFMALIFVFSMVMAKHLLEVQIDERLMKASKENETLVFSYVPSKEPKTTFLVDKDEYHYYLYGIDEAYISYGSTSTTFQNAIVKNYISIEALLDECVKKETKENVNYYIHTSSKEGEDYRVAIKTIRDEEGNQKDFYITLYPASLDLDVSLDSDNYDKQQKLC